MSYNIGDIGHGGIIFFVDSSGEHGLVAAETDQSSASWYFAKGDCSLLELNGFSDWFLPSKDQLGLMFTNLYRQGLGKFAGEKYWSSTEYDKHTHYAWDQYFVRGSQTACKKSFYRHVRAARAF